MKKTLHYLFMWLALTAMFYGVGVLYTGEVDMTEWAQNVRSNVALCSGLVIFLMLISGGDDDKKKSND